MAPDNFENSMQLILDRGSICLAKLLLHCANFSVTDAGPEFKLLAINSLIVFDLGAGPGRTTVILNKIFVEQSITLPALYYHQKYITLSKHPNVNKRN